jgi:hypothetical protein
LIIIVVSSCTDLDAPVYDKVGTFWQTPLQIEQGMAHAYVQLRNYAPTFFYGPNVYDLHEMSTDEIIVPVRGGDWHDQVLWEHLWKHTWTPTSVAVNDGWLFIFSGIGGVNQIIESLESIPEPPDNLNALIAEMRAVRAFYYYQGLDLFGNIPIVETRFINSEEAKTRTRAEVFAFVEKELKEVLPLLSKEVNITTYGRATHWFAQALLAKLYLNAEVYTGESRHAECIQACDAIINSGKYVLEPDFFKNFAIANEDSRENIFSIPFDRDRDMNFFLIQIFSLHYNSGPTFGLESGGANGFCSTAEYLKIFNDDDIRKKMFLVGQQYVNQIEDEEHLQYTSQGQLLIFDPEITSYYIQPPKTETAGARCAKWEFNSTGWGNMSNDFAVYRLADIILMKAEAQFRNGDVGGALTTINQKFGSVSIRSRTGLPDFSAGEMNLDGLLAERARELSWEGHRRNDLIRFDHFTDARIPEKKVSEDFRTLFPIPQAEIDKNDYLEQNPGY